MIAYEFLKIFADFHSKKTADASTISSDSSHVTLVTVDEYQLKAHTMISAAKSQTAKK